MIEQNEKIKIKRSDGRIQFVTRVELEELNFQRKSRDQALASAKPITPFIRLLMICGFAIIIAIVLLWFVK